MTRVQCDIILLSDAMYHVTGSPLEIVTATGDQDNIKEEGGDEQKWKKEMEHMRYVCTFYICRSVSICLNVHSFVGIYVYRLYVCVKCTCITS